NLGRRVAELAPLPHLSDEQLRDMVRFEDETWWREAIGWERPRGVLLLGSHFGNWELFVYAHGRRGHPFTMVHRPIRNPLIDRWLNAFRARAGTRLVRKHHAATEVLRALREKQLLVLPFDQNSTRGLGVFVEFFGPPPARTPASPALGCAPTRPSCRASSSARSAAHATSCTCCPSSIPSKAVIRRPTWSA